MNDQQALWNQMHEQHTHAQMEAEPQKFAVSISQQLQSGMNLLELGCGVGSDARYFAGLGVNVTATDFSDVAIEQNKEKPPTVGLQFAVLDISQPFPYAEASYDVVYAHLSLHYYDNKTTKQIFEEISRVLKPGGMLYFSCKSTDDPLYGHGEEVAPGIFDRKGHLRHFFSAEYTRELLNGLFEEVKLEKVEASYDGYKSAFIQCWARKQEG